MLTPAPVAARRVWVNGNSGCKPGMGQDDTVDTSMPSTPISTAPDITSIDFPTTGGEAPTVTPAPAPGTNIFQSLTPVISSLATTAGKIAQQQLNPFAPGNLPAGSCYQQTPQGGIVVSTNCAPTTVGAAFSTATLGGILPILLIGGIVLVMVSRK